VCASVTHAAGKPPNSFEAAVELLAAQGKDGTLRRSLRVPRRGGYNRSFMAAARSSRANARRSPAPARPGSGSTGWIDVTVPVRSGMPVWPGDPVFQIQRCCSLSRGEEANVSSLSMSAHTGTHVDAPLHYIEGGFGVEDITLDRLMGPAEVLPIGRLPRAIESIPERVLLRTRMSRRQWWNEPFTEDFPVLSCSQAHRLVAAGVRTVGIDYLSIGDAEIHRVLLGAGICVIEGLDLTKAGPGRYEMICLPLRLRDADGAPARVLLRVR
jgi:arylformamidase